MSKTTCTYWNPLDGGQQHRWRWLEELEGQVEALILSHDPLTGPFRSEEGADVGHRHPQPLPEPGAAAVIVREREALFMNSRVGR